MHEGNTLFGRFFKVREATQGLVQPLAIEDMVVQTMAAVSPPKWHLAHTTWFFETFILQQKKGYKLFEPEFCYLFNSYYEGVGPYFPKNKRGTLSRPLVSEVMAYRAYVEDAIKRLAGEEDAVSLELGIQHEQQHQELLLTDILHIFSKNPLTPAYKEGCLPRANEPPPLSMLSFEGGVHRVGYAGKGFAFDNEQPCHEVLLAPYRLSNRLVSAGEYLAFMEDGAYDNPLLWLSDGWDWLKKTGVRAPLYWARLPEGGYEVMTLHGRLPLDPHRPVCHVNYYEADAFARWMGNRLPTEFEWEVAAAALPKSGHFMEEGVYVPFASASFKDELGQAFGDCWEWTSSPYTPYPRFRPFSGAAGEYNGKFMVNQLVLKGGSLVTPKDHIRASYRNFFPAETRWQFSGIRLADDGAAS